MARITRFALSFALLAGVLSAGPALAGSNRQTVDVAVAQTDAPDPVVENAFVTYSILVTNLASHPANDIVAAQVSVDGGEIASIAGHRWKCSPGLTANTQSCFLHGAQPQAHESILTLVVRAPEVSAPATITSTVSASSLQYEDTDTSNNESVERTTVLPGSDLLVDQFDDPNEVTSGDTVRYAVSVVNNGDVPAGDVTVTTSASLGTATETLAAGWTCALAGSGATCELDGGLPAGGSASFDVLVTTPEGAEPGTFTNEATVSSDSVADLDPSNNTSVEETTLTASGDSARGYISPNGGELSTCRSSGVTSGDHTCATGIFPAGPGGVAEIFERPQHAICQVFRCDGSGLLFIAPNGYTRESHGANPILWLYLINDSSPHQGFVEKPLNEDVPGIPVTQETVKPVAKCSDVPVSVVGPCERSEELIDSDGDGLADDLLSIWETLSIDPPTGYK